jgi:hypothetical protein
MKTSGASSRGEFKTIGRFEFVEAPVTGGGVEFVEGTEVVGVFVDGMGKLHAARNDAARTIEDIFRKSRREELFFI